MTACQTVEMTEEFRALVKAKRSELIVDSQQAQREISALGQEVAKLFIREDHTSENAAEVLTGLRHEIHLLKARQQLLQDFAQKLVIEQQIHNVKIDDNSRLTVGLINTEIHSFEIKQNISNVSTTNDSRGIVGIAKNVYLDKFWN